MNLSKKLNGLIVLALLFLSQVAMAQDSSDFKGLWSAEKIGVSQIEFHQDGTVWVAKIKEGSKESQKGKVLFRDGVYDAATNQIKGTLIEPNNDTEISATISIKNDRQLKVVGKKLFMTKTFYWTRL